MYVYLLVASIIFVAAVLFPQRRPNPLAWGAAMILLVLFIGLRHKVGMDWNNYLAMERNIQQSSFIGSFDIAEPGYVLLLRTSTAMGTGVYGANLIGAMIFCFGLFRFARTTPLPWMALATAMPILVIVVAMSANRQAIAIGILMWLCANWENKSLLQRIAVTLMAAAFHQSAIFFLMFAALDLRMRGELKIILGFALGVAMLAFLQLSGGATYYDELYVSGQYARKFSTGASQHVLLNGIPAAMVIFGKGIRSKLFPNSLQLHMGWLALALVPMAYLYSVAAGRMTLYLFPVSMYVFSAIPGLVGGGAQRPLIRTALAAVLGAILWIWLSFANSAIAHIPYRNVLFMDKSELHL